MTLQIEMRGKLDAINVPGNFQHFVDQLNLSAAKGSTYVILEDFNGRHMALNQNNILTVLEFDEDGSTAGMIG